jgi:hypothetical protein
MAIYGIRCRRLVLKSEVLTEIRRDSSSWPVSRSTRTGVISGPPALARLTRWLRWWRTFDRGDRPAAVSTQIAAQLLRPAACCSDFTQVLLAPRADLGWRRTHIGAGQCVEFLQFPL